MEKITAREYARRHRKSLFEVIKMIQQGTLQGEQLEENGRNVQYVFVDKHEDAPSHRTAPDKEIPSPEAHSVQEELALLRKEIERLRAQLIECCNHLSR